MGTDLPIACSLTAAELPARLAEMAAIGRRALQSVEIDDSTATLRFRANPQTRARLAAIVAAEAQCCAFLDMRLSDEPKAVALTIVAPAGAAPVLHDLVALFSGRERAA
jgi:hypothetical protein